MATTENPMMADGIPNAAATLCPDTTSNREPAMIRTAPSANRPTEARETFTIARVAGCPFLRRANPADGAIVPKQVRRGKQKQHHAQ